MSAEIKTVKCLLCQKALEINECGTPNHGTIWRSHGNWGSRVYDSMAERIYLVAYICDDCLVQKQELLVERHVKPSKVEYEDKPPDLR